MLALFAASLALPGSVVGPRPARAASDPSILIVAPHPDDDLLYGAGVASSARSQGIPVRVVYMTNGDFFDLSDGTLRQGEAVAGQAVIGGAEDDLIFLGYPDGYLQNLVGTDAGDVFTTPHGVSATYASRGLGRTDYHTYRFGHPGTYNGTDVLADVTAILETYRPSAIYTTNTFDTHADHQGTYTFVRAALESVMTADPTYRPSLHTTMVHMDGDWPAPIDPATPFTMPPTLPQTTLSWAARESIAVPPAMRSTNLDANPKYRAIEAHQSQGGASDYLGRFIHADEIFWRDDLGTTNRVPVAAAGEDQVVATGATVTLDGSGSSDPDGDLLAYHWTQVEGPEVELSSDSAVQPTFLAPDGASSLTFMLTVSDGTATSDPDDVTIEVSESAPSPTPTPTPTPSPTPSPTPTATPVPTPSPTPPPTESNIAPAASVSASSETASTGQLAIKAVDGVIAGYPADYTREWATAGGRAGSWLTLTWAAPMTIDQIVLYDRPNGNDQVTAGTLHFGDGSTVATGSLANAGTATTLAFGARTVTSVQLAIDAVSASTLNIGLAEIQVYGAPAGGSEASALDMPAAAATLALALPALWLFPVRRRMRPAARAGRMRR